MGSKIKRLAIENSKIASAYCKFDKIMVNGTRLGMPDQKTKSFTDVAQQSH
jgi:hypothetical protein